MPSAALVCPCCKQKSSSQLLTAHIAAYHKNDIKKLFIADSGVQSIQGKHYSTLNLGDGSPFLCCFGCKSGWVSTNIANKHKDGECLVKHKQFLASLDERSTEEKYFESLELISQLQTECKQLKEERNKAISDLELYDQVKKQANSWHYRNQRAVEEYLEQFQKVMKPIIYSDLSNCSVLRTFLQADINGKNNFINEEHVPLSKVLHTMKQVHRDNKFLTAALFPSYMLFLKQKEFEGTTNAIVSGETWLGDQLRYYPIRMPDLSDVDDSIYVVEPEPSSEPPPPSA